MWATATATATASDEATGGRPAHFKTGAEKGLEGSNRCFQNSKWGGRKGRKIGAVEFGFFGEGDERREGTERGERD